MAEPYRFKRLSYSICLTSKVRGSYSDLMKPQEIMKEKMPNLDPNTVAVKAKPKENSEQVLIETSAH